MFSPYLFSWAFHLLEGAGGGKLVTMLDSFVSSAADTETACVEEDMAWNKVSKNLKKVGVYVEQILSPGTGDHLKLQKVCNLSIS